MPSLRLDGRRLEVSDGDTIAAAAFRAGVRTFTRSLKAHRRRGLYCGTGDCANCLVTVDGLPGERACVTPATDGMRVERETGWPSADRDALAINDRLHRFMPVGFYYKVFARPRWLWPIAERVIRRATGTGTLPVNAPARRTPTRFVRVRTLVIGGGVAGLAAAATASTDGSVLVADEAALGARTTDAAAREAITRLGAEARAAGADILAGHAAIGVYEGPSAALVGPDELVEVEAERVIVATGSLEAHGVFPGNDLPGVWLGRGAARMAAIHGVPIGKHAVVVANTDEGAQLADAVRTAGTDVTLVAGRVLEARGGHQVTSVTVLTPEGRRAFACDALVLSLGWAPRDTLLRMTVEPEVVGAGDVVRPGCTLDEAESSGRAAARGNADEPREADPWPITEHDGYVCVCEDVSMHDLEHAWDEGWTSSEILKRYTTATMGPCQGALCSRHLAEHARAKGAAPAARGRTTARPPVRGPRLGDLTGGVHEQAERRTALHDRHVSAGARMDHSGVWLRPGTYGDVADEIRAVRERVSVMDVSTLAKFLLAGRDAQTLLDRVFPLDVGAIAPGRARYLLALDEAGYVMDDGLLAALHSSYFLTSTSGGADRMEAWLRNWIDRLDLHVHLVNQTSQLGAINVAGPHARDLLATLSVDDLSRDALPYPGYAEITVAGVPCRAIAVGFVGELSFELHHPRGRSVELWDALLNAGSTWDIRPHGLDALDVLRLEKGHVYLAQDTMPDDHPAKLGLGWAVATHKAEFVGKRALERMDALPLERRLVGLRFDGPPQRGHPLAVDGAIVGRITSCAVSVAAGGPVGLGWLRAVDGEFPNVLRAGDVTATVSATPFYDPEGVRLRG
ncbi:MAG TPA: 2Fe-2S iron-sulfur cluster-binding protein [Actinomycetota bacterium]|nr:2Fe-2S iron-sulfur cluster-binding protein [Actinomycetota bacterium]